MITLKEKKSMGWAIAIIGGTLTMCIEAGPIWSIGFFIFITGVNNLANIGKEETDEK